MQKIREKLNTILDNWRGNYLSKNDAINEIIEAFVNNENDSISDVSLSYSFDDFWNDYDKKVGKLICIKLWSKLTEIEKQLIKDNIPKYKEARPDKSKRKDPERYLKHKTFLDEIVSYNQENKPKNEQGHYTDKLKQFATKY